MMNGLRRILAAVFFFGGIAYAGFMAENLKGAIPDVDRVILVIGFTLGLYFLATWMVRLGEGANEGGQVQNWEDHK
ncbi:hypothetical protein K3172_10430 [Qipengyuania sp. 6B39]|uniref:hypothetical protein n=1 Tax=Qipengyuania proteolytica TaxID=2867239 RepID=UPI001C8A6950|nr:hypothetical protein [Qipengyuania proteolytica]MBX7496269.1 hypothetical protein [Qipengyuania proteolytica]